MISPILNYMIYLGLKRYGVSEMQSAVALSSARMYSNILREYNITPDFIYPQKT